MGGKPGDSDPLTRRMDEGIEEYLARLETLERGRLSAEQRRMLEELMRAVRHVLHGDQTPPW
jgi:hypothetical protein